MRDFGYNNNLKIFLGFKIKDMARVYKLLIKKSMMDIGLTIREMVSESYS
jgi:hypothetical protein